MRHAISAAAIACAAALSACGNPDHVNPVALAAAEDAYANYPPKPTAPRMHHTEMYREYRLPTADGGEISGQAFEAAVMCMPDGDARKAVLDRLKIRRAELSMESYEGTMATGEATAVIALFDEHGVVHRLMVDDHVVAECAAAPSSAG